MPPEACEPQLREHHQVAHRRRPVVGHGRQHLPRRRLHRPPRRQSRHRNTHAGFHVARPDRLRAAALETARADLWRRHVIIDALDIDAEHAALVGVKAALEDYRPVTYAEHTAALEAGRANRDQQQAPASAD